MLAVPVGVLLKDPRSADDRGVGAGFADELQSERKFVVGESARNRKCRQSAEIANAAERIGKSDIGFQIGFERRGADWLRRGDQHVEIFEEVSHFLLHDFAYLQGANVIGGGNLFVEVAVNL